MVMLQVSWNRSRNRVHRGYIPRPPPPIVQPEPPGLAPVRHRLLPPLSQHTGAAIQITLPESPEDSGK